MNTKLNPIKPLPLLMLLLAGGSPLAAAEATRLFTVTPVPLVSGSNAFEFRCTDTKLAWTKHLPVVVFQKYGRWQQYWTSKKPETPLSLTLAPAYQALTLQQLGDKICSERSEAVVRAEHITAIDCTQAGDIYRAALHLQCERDLDIAQYEKNREKKFDVLALMSPDEAKQYLREQIEAVQQQLKSAKNKLEMNRLEAKLKTLQDKLDVLNLMSSRSLAGRDHLWTAS